MANKKNVLLIDDDPDFISILQKRLKKLRYNVDTAHDGDEGLTKVKSNPPDLIVLDVMMPVKDGLQTCKELKSDQKTSEIPVILLTAVEDYIAETSYTHFDTMSVEAEEYIPKGPECTQEIVKAVQEFL